MPDKEQPPLRIVVTAHPKLPEANSDANDVIAYLSERGIQSEYGLLYDDELTRKVKSGAFNMMIALGGDGTMLRAGHLCGPADIPIFGINLGRFGFLMDVRQNQWLDVMPRLLKRDYWLERRMMLAVEHCRGEDIISRWDVLNEIVIGRGQMVRPVHLVTEVDGRYLTTYVADALIASTPTGSTAYALATGVPILPPELRNILLVAVAPHLSIDRAIVLAEGSSVTIMVYSDHQAVFSADVQVPIGLADGDRICVRASEHTAQFIRFQDPGYFYRNLTPHMNQNPSTGGYR